MMKKKMKTLKSVRKERAWMTEWQPSDLWLEILGIPPLEDENE